MTNAVVSRESSKAAALLAALAVTVPCVYAVNGTEVFSQAEVALRSLEGWIMGGTTIPDPDQNYMDTVQNLYLNSNGLGGDYSALNTPEEFCPIVCFPAPPDDPSNWSSMNFGQSLNAGVAALHAQLTGALSADPNSDLGVFGYSQSATLGTIEMQQLAASGITDPNLHFVFVGDPNSPLGGILSRFDFTQNVPFADDMQHVPFVNIPLGIGAAPTDDFSSIIYTGEYDGWGDFPQDPLNLVADLNALIGIATVHPYYPSPTPGDNLDIGGPNHVIDIGTIGDTQFYGIPAALPLLAFMYDGGPAGQFFYNLFAPFLRTFIDWSYGNAGDPAVDGLNVATGSWYDENVGWAGGPWAMTPFGELSDADPTAGFFEKMDPLQMLAGLEYAFTQTVTGPTADLLSDLGMSDMDISNVVNTMTDVLNFIDGYTATEFVDSSILKLVDSLGPTATSLVDGLFDGPLIPGDGALDLVGGAFDIFNVFGA